MFVNMSIDIDEKEERGILRKNIWIMQNKKIAKNTNYIMNKELNKHLELENKTVDE